MNPSRRLLSDVVSAICVGGCGHGRCAAPNNCRCDSGWTGRQCNTGRRQPLLYRNDIDDANDDNLTTTTTTIMTKAMTMTLT